MLLLFKSMAGVKLLVALLVVVVAIGGNLVGAQVHHVVGDDRGWDPSSGVGSWSSGRIFAVGDKLWFTYSAAQDKVVEVKSKEEYEACDVSNPIKMYRDGLDGVSLDREGIRYFASGKPENCRKGLKLHVEVQPHGKRDQGQGQGRTFATSEMNAMALADGPTTPSGSAHLYYGFSQALVVGLLVCYMGV